MDASTDLVDHPRQLERPVPPCAIAGRCSAVTCRQVGLHQNRTGLGDGCSGSKSGNPLGGFGDLDPGVVQAGLTRIEG